MWIHDMFGADNPLSHCFIWIPLPGDPVLRGHGWCWTMRPTTPRGIAGWRRGWILIANGVQPAVPARGGYCCYICHGDIIGKLKDRIRGSFWGQRCKESHWRPLTWRRQQARFAGGAVFSGAYMGEYGVYVSNSGEAVRHRKVFGNGAP